MIQRPKKGEHRTPEQLREQYEVEKELASRLRHASKQERQDLYSFLYDELYRRVPHHRQLTKKSSPEARRQAVAAQMKYLKPFLNRDMTFLEVGPGDCALSLEMTRFVKQVYAVDVSDEITKDLSAPKNFQLILSDGVSIPIPHNCVDVAYSNQLMEHLHPDDALEQLQNIYNALVPGGAYICITPNRLTGPHDISRYFDVVATGFHMKEYTVSELQGLFKKVGFSQVRQLVGGRGRYISSPVSPSILWERLLHMVPRSLVKSSVVQLPSNLLLGVRLIGIK